MAEYDPQRSRPRRRVTDESGPAPVDAMLDAPARGTQPSAGDEARAEPTPADAEAAPPRNGDRPPASPVADTGAADTGPDAGGTAASPVAASDVGDARRTEVVDLAPAPPIVVERSSRRARLLLVAVVVAVALVGFVLRRVGAGRRARRLADD